VLTETETASNLAAFLNNNTANAALAQATRGVVYSVAGNVVTATGAGAQYVAARDLGAYTVTTNSAGITAGGTGITYARRLQSAGMATGSINLNAQVSAGDQIFVGGNVTATNAITFTNAYTTAANTVLIGSNLTQTAENLYGFLANSTAAAFNTAKYVRTAGAGTVRIDILHQNGGAQPGFAQRYVATTGSTGVIQFGGAVSGTTPAGFTGLAGGNAGDAGADAFVFNGVGGAGTGIVVDFTTSATDSSRVFIGTDGGPLTADQISANIVAFLNRSTDSKVTDFRFISRITTAAGQSQIWADYKTKLTQAVGNGTVNASLVAPLNISGGLGTAAGALTAGGNFDTRDVLLNNKTSAFGTVKGSVLVDTGIRANYTGSAINVLGIQDNAVFVG